MRIFHSVRHVVFCVGAPVTEGMELYRYETFQEYNLVLWQQAIVQAMEAEWFLRYF